MKTPALESQTIPQKIHQTTRNVIQAADLNSKLGEGRLTVKQKYTKHSKGHLHLNKVINRCLAKEKKIHGIKFFIQIRKQK